MKRFSQNKNKRIRVTPIKVESAYYRNFKNKINEVKLKDIKEDYFIFDEKNYCVIGKWIFVL
jgi:hypothetical protein